jgi:hypothetical protein
MTNTKRLSIMNFSHIWFLTSITKRITPLEQKQLFSPQLPFCFFATLIKILPDAQAHSLYFAVKISDFDFFFWRGVWLCWVYGDRGGVIACCLSCLSAWCLCCWLLFVLFGCCCCFALFCLFSIACLHDGSLDWLFKPWPTDTPTHTSL